MFSDPGSCVFRAEVTPFPSVDKVGLSALNNTLKSLRMWRNWQTRKVQVLVGATPWRFDSSHPQYLSRRPSVRVPEVTEFTSRSYAWQAHVH